MDAACSTQTHSACGFFVFLSKEPTCTRSKGRRNAGCRFIHNPFWYVTGEESLFSFSPTPPNSNRRHAYPAKQPASSLTLHYSTLAPPFPPPSATTPTPLTRPQSKVVTPAWCDWPRTSVSPRLNSQDKGAGVRGVWGAPQSECKVHFLRVLNHRLCSWYLLDLNLSLFWKSSQSVLSRTGRILKVTGIFEKTFWSTSFSWLTFVLDG